MNKLPSDFIKFLKTEEKKAIKSLSDNFDPKFHSKAEMEFQADMLRSSHGYFHDLIKEYLKVKSA